MKHSHKPSDASARISSTGPRRWGRAQEDGIGDSYKRPLKLPEPAVCRKCGAVYSRGRWHWAAPPENAVAMLCQACHREEDNYPAGLMLLTGSYLAAHRFELIELIRNQESAERAEHPLNRIMSLDEIAPDRLVIATTDIHLPHRIGEALRRAHDGRLWEDFDKGSYFVRVEWHRDLES